MRRASIIMLAVLLTGCSTQANVKKQALTAGTLSTSTQDYFEYLKKQDSTASTVIDDIYQKVMDKEFSSKKYQKEINKQLKTAEKSYGNSMEKYAKMYGFKNAKEFESKSLVPNIRTRLAAEKYLQANLKKVMDKHKASWVRTIVLTDKGTAESAARGTAKEFMALYNKAKKRNDYGIVSDLNKTGIPSDITKNLSGLRKAKDVYPKVMKDGKKYIVACVYNTKMTKAVKAQTVSILESSGIDNEVKTYYLKKNNFKVYDSDLKKAIHKANSEL